MSTAPKPAVRRRKRRLFIFVAVLLIALTLAAPVTYHHLRAAAVLLRFSEPDSHSLVAKVGRHEIDVQQADFNGIRARLYIPHGVEHPPGIVVLHGIHRLGIDEPRLVRFSRALAENGLLVLTPELASLADYHISAADIAVIGGAAHQLRQRTGRPVGILGLSFAGGLSLEAAADPHYQPDVAYVIAVGAQDDTARVLRYLATGDIPRPDGSVFHLSPHEYGALVAIYNRVERFFPAADVANAREAIRLWLAEQPDEAHQRATLVSPESRKTLEALFAHDDAVLAPDILREIDNERDELARISPAGHLGSLRVPVFLLHGAGDNVIPPTETAWLAREVPQPYLRAVLISPAISHVELGGAPKWTDNAELVHFVEEFLDEAHSR